MQNIFNQFLKVSIASFAVVILISSCKKKYEEPPLTGLPNIVANTTIKDLKARYTAQGTTVAVTDDVVIEGIVNMDDKSGNYYQQISIQDATGGILLRLSGSNLNTSYPVGRKVYVKAKGLYLGDYGRMIQLGGGVDTINGGVTLLTANLQDQHIIKGAINQPLVPTLVTYAQLGTNLQDPYVNTLIKLENSEFNIADLSKNYADLGFSGNRTVQGCTSPATNKITLRTSDFANFATIPVAQGNGDILGIYSLFNTTKQLTIRDTSDVRFNGPRCSGGAVGGTPITLGTSPYLINFDNLASGLPTGVSVATGASATALGISGTYTSATNTSLWAATGAGFKNYASATGLTSTSDSTAQVNATNRALGVRQTSSVGYDPGAAFLFLLNNTTGKNNLKLDFLLQSLDISPSVTRTTTWSVDFGFGDAPTTFTPTTATGILVTGNKVFSSNPVSVTFPAAVNNQSQKVWVRIVTLTPTSGANNRPSTAIDDVKFSWN